MAAKRLSDSARLVRVRLVEDLRSAADSPTLTPEDREEYAKQVLRVAKFLRIVPEEKTSEVEE